MTQEVLSVPEGYVIDFIDGKLRKDKPEEYVRQNVEKRIVEEHQYLPNQMSVEFRIKMGSAKPRVDLAIYSEGDKKIQENIEIIIECKNEKIKPSDKKEGIGQLKSYMSACLNCEWGMWTNGNEKFAYRKITKSRGKLDFESVNDIPSKGRSISEIDRPTRDSLKLASEDNLLFAFRTCHNHIHSKDGLSKSESFFELLKVIFCKIFDEKNIPNKLEFYSGSKEKLSKDGQLTVKNRIEEIYKKVRKHYPTIFEKNDEIRLKPTSLANVVSELQKYSFLDTHIDVKGKAYEEIVGSNLRGDRGEFFTPRNIAHMTIDMLDIPLTATVLDPACGTGGFLVIGMNNVIKRLRDAMEDSTGKSPDKWSDTQRQLIVDRSKEIASKNFYGLDINPDLVKATKMNMVMNNDGSGNILHTDSLLPPHEWSDEIKTLFCKQFNLTRNSIRRHSDLELFDVVVTNPPFGIKLPINEPYVLEQYDLGHIWREDKKTGKLFKTDKLVTSRSPEVLFIERCYQFLKPGGKMGIVLPDAILGAPGLEYALIREWILQKFQIIASIDLHTDTFQPKNRTQTSVLFLKKKLQEEIDEETSKGKMNLYDVFFAMADKIGHDKRGNPIYKRDNEGNELFTSIDSKTIHSTGRKILDDQTNEIAEIFLKWKDKEDLDW